MTEMIVSLVFLVLGLLATVLFLVVLIKQFKHGGALQGILGLITCGFWTFIWGWIKHRSLAMTKLMVLWTVIQLAPVVLIGVFGAAMLGQMYKMFQEFAGDPSAFIQQSQNKVLNPKPNNEGAPITPPKRTAKRAPIDKNVDWHAKALSLWKDGIYTDPNKAKRHWDNAIAINPKFAEAYNNRGLAFYNLNRHQEAIKDFSQAIRMNPQYAEAFNNRGNSFYELDQYEKAEADFNISIQLKPKYAKAHLNRGLVYFQKQEMEPACSDFRRACDLGECDALQWAMQNGFCK
jgi:hypothetical protein